MNEIFNEKGYNDLPQLKIVISNMSVLTIISFFFFTSMIRKRSGEERFALLPESWNVTKNSNQSKAEVKLKEVFMISKTKEQASITVIRQIYVYLD